VRLTVTRLATAVAFLLLATPLVAEAQGTGKIPRVGIVAATSPAARRQSVDAFRRELRELGYIDGQSIIIEERWADGKLERFGDLIVGLLRSQVDVIVVGSSAGALAAKNAATTTPVVFVAATDPIGSGIVSSLARPGGNLTGTSLLIGEEFAGKWVELVRDVLPRISGVAALGHTDHPMTRRYVMAMEAAARTLGLKLQVFDVRDVGGLDSALSMIAKAPPGALIVPASPLFGAHRNRRFRSGAEDPDDRARPVACRGWHSNVVRPKHRRLLPPRRHVRRQDPERRQARRPPGRAADEVRVSDQHEDRQGARAHDPAIAPAAGGSGHRVIGRYTAGLSARGAA